MILIHHDKFEITIIIIIGTIIKTTSVCGADAKSVRGGRGWLASDTDGLAGWPVTVGVVEVGVGVSASQEQTLSGTGVRVYTAHRLTGRGDGYQCGLDWGRSSNYNKR